MRKKKLNTKQIIIKILVLLTIIGGSIALFLHGNGLSKIAYLYILATFIIPIVVFYAKAKFLYNSPKEKLVIDNQGNIKKVKMKDFKKGGNNHNLKQQFNNQNKEYKPSESPNTKLDIYKQVSKTFSNSMKEKLLKRSDIIQFKKELNKLLDSNINHYQGFTFENDAHEVYIKLKNQYLTIEDYESLLYYLNTLLRTNLDNSLKEVK